MANLINISPDYPRIPHLDKSISKMTHDDILSDKIEYPIDCYVQEKIDGSNMGVSWYNNGPVLRNRKHILRKGYSKIRTPAKEQFKSAWNWVHDHKKDIQKISNKLKSEVTIYGDWMYAYHSIKYNRLPDWFIAYDIWVVEDDKFLSTIIVKNILLETKISYIEPIKMVIKSDEEVVSLSEMKSNYTDGIREGIIIKTVEGIHMKNSYKVVNKYFNIRRDFNDVLLKNECL